MRRLSPEQQRHLIARIRNGSYPHIAAESVGVPRTVFKEWMKQGSKQKRGWRRQFWLAVMQARAEVRALMEIQAKDDPKFWLRYGPGKEGGERYGWGTPTKRQPRKKPQGADWQPELFQLLGELAARLESMPEARQAVLEAMGRISNH